MEKFFDKNKFVIRSSEYSDPKCFNINEKLLKEFDKSFHIKKWLKKILGYNLKLKCIVYALLKCNIYCIMIIYLIEITYISDII